MKKKELLVVSTSRNRFSKEIERWCFSDGGACTVEECVRLYRGGAAEFAVKDRFGKVHMIYFGGQGGSASDEPSSIQKLLETLPACKTC